MPAYEVTLLDMNNNIVGIGTVPSTNVRPDGTLDFTFGGLTPGQGYIGELRALTEQGLFDMAVVTINAGSKL